MKSFFVVLVLLLSACSKKSHEEHLSSAKSYLAESNNSAAEVELKNAIRLQPKNAEIRFLLGKVYLATNRYELAEKELNRALEAGFNVSEVIPLLSRAYHKAGTSVELSKLKYKQGVLTPEQEVEVAFYKVKALINLDKITKAKVLINEIKNKKAETSFKKLALAYEMIIRENIEAAELIINEVLSEKATQPDALKLKAEFSLNRNEKAEAANWYKKYYQAFPQDHRISFLLARLLTEIDKTQEAEPIVDKLLAINNNHVLLNQLKAAARYSDNDYQSTLEYTKKVLNIESENIPARVMAGFSSYFLKDYSMAATYLSLIADKLPTEHPAIKLLAASQLALGQSLAANETIESFDIINSQDSTLVSQVGLSLLQSGQIDKAKEVVKKVGDKAESAQALTQLGVLQLSLNDLDGITKLEQANEIATDKNMVRQTLATAYISTKSFDKALALAEKWKIEEPTNIKAWLLSGVSHMQMEKFDQAKEEFSTVLSKDVNNAQAYLALAELSKKQGNSEQAISYLEQLLSIDETNLAGLVKLYELKKTVGDSASIVAKLRNVYKENSENNTLRTILAKILLVEGQASESIELLASMPEESKISNGYWQTLAEAYWQKKDFVNASQHFKAWLEQQPNNKSAILGNLILLDGKREYKEGLELTTNYLAKDKSNLPMQMLHIHFLLMNNDVEAAKTAFEPLPKAVKSTPFAKGLLGMIQLTEQKYNLAVENLKQAYAVSPNSRNVRMIYLGLLRQKNQQQAQEFIETHTSKFPNDVESMLLLANGQISQDESLAIQSYENILKVQPKNLVALNNLAYFYMQKGQLSAAKEYAQQAKALQPKQPDVLDTLAQILMLEKNYGEALEHLSVAINNSAVKEEIYLNYVEALVLNDQKLLAKRKLTEREFKLAPSIEKLKVLKEKYGLN